MLVLDWTHHSLACPSLGNICGLAFASEYIHKHHEKTRVIIPEWYSDIWPLFVDSELIVKHAQSGDTLKICNAYDINDGLYNWITAPLAAAGFTPNTKKFTPRTVWTNSRYSRRVLIYPREHHNGNRTYSSTYWIEVCQILQNKGYSLVAILDSSPSHRDGDNSVLWCNEIRNQIQFEYVFEPRIEYLQAAVSLSKLAIGVMTGPAWLMLKSTIKQIILQSETDDPVISNWAENNLPFFSKDVKLIKGTSLDWINNL